MPKCDFNKIALQNTFSLKHLWAAASEMNTSCNVTMIHRTRELHIAAQKIKFSIKDFCSKCDQIYRFRRIWSYLLNKFLVEKIFFGSVL